MLKQPKVYISRLALLFLQEFWNSLGLDPSFGSNIFKTLNLTAPFWDVPQMFHPYSWSVSSICSLQRGPLSPQLCCTNCWDKNKNKTRIWECSHSWRLMLVFLKHNSKLNKFHKISLSRFIEKHHNVQFYRLIFKKSEAAKLAALLAFVFGMTFIGSEELFLFSKYIFLKFYLCSNSIFTCAGFVFISCLVSNNSVIFLTDRDK